MFIGLIFTILQNLVARKITKLGIHITNKAIPLAYHNCLCDYYFNDVMRLEMPI